MRRRTWSRGDVAFAVAFAAYVGLSLVLLGLGVLARLASISPDVHLQLHITGFADSNMVERVALGIAGASHLPQSIGGIALDYAFSVFNIGLALFLLRLRPRNVTARLLAVGMTGTSALFNLQAHSVYELMRPGIAESSLHYAYQFVTTAAYFYALLLFPDGRPVPHWPRLPLFLLYGLGTLGVALESYQLQSSHRVSVLIFFALAVPLVGVFAQAYRYRRATTESERQQSRLLFWALIPALLLGLVVTGQGVTDIVFPQLQGRSLSQLPETVFRVFQPVFTIIPVALVVGIARYRLWDVDRLISRALVYGSLAAFVSAVYIGMVVGVGNVIGSRGGNLGLSIIATAIAAAAFGPLRDRLQRLANRLVYGRRATPYEVLSELSSRLAETLETEQLLSRMARVLADGTGAREAEVWLKVGNGLRLAAAWPAFEESTTVALAGDQLPSLGDARHAVPVLHRGELLGALALKKPEALTQTEEKLVTDLAAQAGLVMRNVSLTAELMLRLEELRLSRQRLVAASNDARRRIERNIHDGAQQQLVAMMVRLNLAERVAEKEAPKVHEMLSQIKAEAVEALENLRDLARGIYPPLLASNGLAAALEAQARKVPLDVTVSCDGVGRYDQETEAAIYFCCLEALQNVAKSAHATRGSVRLHQDQGRLHFEVEDDGVGFDPASSTRGAGLQNMIDRVEALSGTLLIDSAPGRGTRIGGWVPATHPAELT